MKKFILSLAVGLGLLSAHSQTLVNSWENSQEGWTIVDTNDWTSDGFSTTNGVTVGIYSWKLAASGEDYGPTLAGPNSTTMTGLLANSDTISVDVYVTSNNPTAFGGYTQWDLHVVQATNSSGQGLGDVSLDGGVFYQSPNVANAGQTTLKWELSSAMRATLAANPALPAHLVFEIGGGGAGTIYLDNLRVSAAPVLVNSFEGSPEGWTNLEASSWTSDGFSTATGLTDGAYSWELTATSENYGPTLAGPASTSLTGLLAEAASVTIDVLAPTNGSFGYYMQWDLAVNQPGGAGNISLDGGNFSESPVIGAQHSSILTWTVSPAVRASLAANPTLPTQLIFSIGGGGAGTVFVDDLRVNEEPLVLNSWENSQEGWTNLETANWTTTAFSTTQGVTLGTYSWALSTTSEDYGSTLAGPASTTLAAELANASAISMDILTPVAGSFGYYMQWDLHINQPGGAGSVSLDNGNYTQDPNIGGPEATLTWEISPAVRSALAANPTLPAQLVFSIGGGGAGTAYVDNLRLNPLGPAAVATPAQLWVRETWDDDVTELFPAIQAVTNDPSSVGFAPTIPWITNPSESGIGGTPTNTTLIAIRDFFPEPDTIGLPPTLDGTTVALVQDNGGGGHGLTTLWTDGDYMTRQLSANNYINFMAEGEYWFAMTIGNSPSSFDATYGGPPYTTSPAASGAGGIGFADGDNDSANFVAVGVSGLDVFLGPTNAGNPFGTIPAGKSVYISQGTLSQPGDPYSTNYNPQNDPTYSGETVYQTNFTGGPYYIDSFGTNRQGQCDDTCIVVLGHLRTHPGGNATMDARFYDPANGDSLDTTTNITWDCSYDFHYTGTMTKMLVFENGEFPFYLFAFRASTNLAEVLGIDPGYIAVSPLSNTFTGFPINMTNFAAVAIGYGPLTYQWYQNGTAIANANSQNFNIASASTSDSSMPAGTDAGTYTCVATDSSGTWGSVTTAPVVITITHELAPAVTGVQLYADQSTIQLTIDEPGLTGADVAANYTLTGGVVVTNASATEAGQSTIVQLQTTTQPVGSRLTLTINGITNQAGQSIVANTTETFWTDIPETGVADDDYWAFPSSDGDYGYFNTFLPANPNPPIAATYTLSAWDGPTSGVTINGGTYFGGRMYGWFIPPVTTNYVFFISCDDGGRLSLSTNSSPANLCVIACETDWSADDEWTNYSTVYNSGDHRGDGTATGIAPTNNGDAYGWDNSAAAGSYNGQGVFIVNPATADQQNRSDQFIVAYYDSSGAAGGPPQATNSWANALSQVTDVVPTTPTPRFWPKVDANGQALITLQAGQKYFMQLEHCNVTGGYDESVTYKFAGAPDPVSPSASLLTGNVISALVPFTPSISSAKTPGGPVISYSGVLLSGNTVLSITNPVPGAVSSNGPAQYTPPGGQPDMFYKASEQ